jgi:endonuclease/exonuclease/phosphatase (EEP) superfamily protein YafD
MRVEITTGATGRSSWPTLVFRLLLAGLVATGLVLTLLRLTHPESGLAVRATSFAPLAVPLYLLALGFLVGKLVFPGRDSWQPWAALTVVVAGALALHVMWLVPLFTGNAPEPAAGKQRLQVMSVNLHHGEGDPARVVETAAIERVHILVLQEVTIEELRELDRYGIGEAFPYRAGDPGEGPAGTMVFSSFPLRGAARLDTAFGSWAMTVAAPGGPLRLYAVHPRPPLGDAESWRNDLDSLRKAAEADRDLDLMVGDFNSTADHAEFRAFSDDADLHDAAELANAGWTPTWPDQGFKTVLGFPVPPLVQIDHVLVGRSMTATEVSTFTVEDTDHRGVLVEVAPR